MGLIRSCLCWREIQNGSLAAGVYCMTISMMQLFTQVAVWTGDGSMTLLKYPPYLVYIPLAAMDFTVIIVSVILLIGLEKHEAGRQLLLPWLGLMVIYVLYEAGINLYLFAVEFPLAIEVQRNGNTDTTGGEIENIYRLKLSHLIVLVVYWAMKIPIYVLSIVCVLSHYQELGVGPPGPGNPDRRDWFSRHPYDNPANDYHNTMTRGQEEAYDFPLSPPPDYYEENSHSGRPMGREVGREPRGTNPLSYGDRDRHADKYPAREVEGPGRRYDPYGRQGKSHRPERDHRHEERDYGNRGKGYGFY